MTNNRYERKTDGLTGYDLFSILRKALEIKKQIFCTMACLYRLFQKMKNYGQGFGRNFHYVTCFEKWTILSIKHRLQTFLIFLVFRSRGSYSNNNDYYYYYYYSLYCLDKF